MPNYRKGGKKRNRYSRRRKRLASTYNKSGAWGTVKSIASKAAKGLVKYYLNPEFKWLDTVNSGVSIVNSWTITPLHAIPQGDTENTRDGYSVKLTSYNHTYTCRVGATSPVTVRIMLIWMNQSQGTNTVNMTQVLATVSDIRSPYNLYYSGEYKILKDDIFTLNSVAYPEKVGEYYTKLNNHIKFNGATGTTAEVGGLYWAIMSDAGATQPTYTLYSRIRYLDN